MKMVLVANTTLNHHSPTQYTGYKRTPGYNRDTQEIDIQDIYTDRYTEDVPLWSISCLD